MASHEAAGTPTLAEIQTLIQTLMDNEVNANVDAGTWLMPPDTVMDYADIAGGIAYFERNQAQGSAVDGGKFATMPTINGRPIVVCPGLTSVISLFLTPEAQAKVVEFRPITIEQMAKNDDSTIFSITSSEILVVENPKMAGKIT